MQNYRTQITILSILIVLATAAIACNMPSTSRRSTDKPADTASTPTEFVLTEPASSEAGSVTITLTEGQLNTIVQQALKGQTDQPIEELQVRLESGQVILTGTVNQNGLSLPMRLTLTVDPDGQGGLNYQVTSASVGPLPLPQSLRDQIETMLNQNLQAQVRQLTNNLYIESINIGNGLMTVTGQPQ
jgi:uncharacterized protein YpmS